MAEDTPLDDRFDLRINFSDKQNFIEMCGKMGRSPQPVMRQLMRAFSEKRLRIKMPDKKLKLMQELYADDN